jgi:alpha-galactosidase
VEADLTKWGRKDLKELAGYISLYQEIRPLIQFGDFYRLESPFEGPRASWIFVSPERSQALLFIFQTEPWKRGTKVHPLRLRGLAPLRNYSIEGIGKFRGDRLMGVGWLPSVFRKPSKKSTCELYHLKG